MYSILFLGLSENISARTLPILHQIPNTLSTAASFGNGRLGNQLCNFASQYALYREFGIPSYVSQYSYQILQNTFTLQNINSTNTSRAFRIKDSFDFHPLSIVYVSNIDLMQERQEILYTYRYSWFLKLEPYVCNVKAFSNDLGHLKQTFFRFKPNVLKLAKCIMKKLVGRMYRRPRIITIHLRMKDIEQHMQKLFDLPMASQEYFTRAMLHIQRKFGENVIFCAYSDDTVRAKLLLLTPRNEKFTIIFPIFEEQDSSSSIVLALLSFAEGSILTYSTFGLWGALLRKTTSDTILPIEIANTDIGRYVSSANISGVTFM